MAANPHDLYAQERNSEVLSQYGQHLVTLSDENKDALLSEVAQLTHNHESRDRAAAILARLEDLSPQVAQQFQLKQDALANINFRMICAIPQCDVQPIADAVPSYIAVSYCWHYPQQWPLAAAATPISEGWEISESMMEAVMALRQSPDEGVWLDKLCINQEDRADKATHIGVMDTVYRSARRIAILLEDVQLTKNEEEAGLTYAKFYEELCGDVKKDGLEGEQKSLFIEGYFPRRTEELRNSSRGHIPAAAQPFVRKILGARWFGRAWCAHESRMTKHEKVNNPLFMCFGSGNQVLQFEFRFIHFLGLHLCQSEQPQDTPSGSDFMERLNDPEPETLRQFWWRIQRLLPDTSASLSGMQHIASVLSFGCYKKGDLMSIALNTAGIPLCFTGEDVRSVEEVIWKFSLLVLASEDLVPLVTIGSKLRIPAAGGDIISWATNPAQGVLEDRIPNPLPGSITGITQEYIELDLLVFESLPEQASPESKDKATRFIGDQNLDAIADEMLLGLGEFTQRAIRISTAEMTRIKPHARPLPDFRHLILSLAIDNGVDWILDFPSTVQQSIPSTWMHGALGFATSTALIPAAHSLLALLNLDTTTSETFTLVVQKAAQSLTALLDPRLILLTPNPRRLPIPPMPGSSSSNTTTITGNRTSSAALTSATSNRTYVAVPTALAHLPAWHDRAWLVEPFNPAAAAAAEPERPEDFFPLPGLRVSTPGGGETDERKVEDMLPVLSSDYADRRAPVDPHGDGAGAWRMRNRQVLLGDLLGGLLEGGDGVMLARKQRVYGCEDYPWDEIHQVVKTVVGEGLQGGGVV